MQFFKIPFINKSELDFCCSCCIGKPHKLHSPSSHTTYNQPLELIFDDQEDQVPLFHLLGITITLFLLRPILGILGFFLLKAMCEILIIFKQIQAMVEKQFGFPIKAIRTGWGESFDLLLPFYSS